MYIFEFVFFFAFQNNFNGPLWVRLEVIRAVPLVKSPLEHKNEM